MARKPAVFDPEPVKPADPISPATIPMPTQPEMEIRNQRYMDLIVRELREQVLRGQQRRADGVIVIEAAVESGALSNRVSVLSKYRVKLGG